MQIIEQLEAIQHLTKLTGKWGMSITLDDGDDCAEIAKAAPYLKDRHQIFLDNCAYLLFDTEEEMEKCYDMTVGDDGPTELNSYDGPARVFAVTCSSDGNILSENT